MDLREVAKSPRGLAAAAGLIVLAVLLHHWLGGATIPANLKQAFFSDDDGRSYFADDINQLYPFDHNGKPAYRTYVYKCGGGAPFVAYVERLTDAGRAKITELRQKPAAEVGNQIADTISNGTDVKKPGEAKWVSAKSSGAGEIVRPKCPDGGVLKGVYP